MPYSLLLDANSHYLRFIFELGAEANARGARALPLLMREPNRVPDHTFSGLDLPHDEGGRRRFFGEY